MLVFNVGKVKVGFFHPFKDRWWEDEGRFYR